MIGCKSAGELSILIPMLLFRLFLIIAAAVIFTTLPSPASTVDTQSGAKPVLVDISPLTLFLNRLPPDEKEEQLRDWALYGLRNSLGLPSEGDIPIRRQVQQYADTAEIAPGRLFVISKREWGILLPREQLNKRPPVGGLVDRQYAATNTLPERILLYGYTYDAPSATITITPERTISAAEVYSGDYGYHTTTAATLDDLIAFTSRIDDIVQVRLRPDRIELGGRRYRRDNRGMLKAEEIAALYQAYHTPLSSGEKGAYESFVRKKLAEMTRKDRKLRADIKSGARSEAQLLESIRRRYPAEAAVNRDLNVGFSLDPSRNIKGLADDMEQYTRELRASQNPGGSRNAPSYTVQSAAIETAARRVRTSKDPRPLLTLMETYDRSANSLEREIGIMLHSIELRHSYQSARYIGNLQGTSTGMILFYTDLLAKLWAFDYEGSAPKQAITGFRSMLDVSVPKLYWNDFLRLTQTRLWFGMRQEGFNLFGDRLLFQPTATRVYAASSNPLSPGKESRANYQSGEFLGWWDRHYDTVAGYEPYYRKLNQIQKWSCIFMILKEKRFRQFDYLAKVPVDRTLDFERWLKENSASLTSPVKIAFLDRTRFGRTTECLPLLVSRSHQLMEKHFVLGGGVTLASRREILAKMLEHDAATLRRQRTAAPGGAASDSSGELHRPVTAKGPAPGTSPRPPSPAEQQAAGRPAAERVAERTAASPPAAARKAVNTGRSGTFTAEKRQGTIRLKWEKSPAVAADELVGTLADLQQTTARGSRGEALFRSIPDLRASVRVKEGETYLVRTAATGNSWIQLSINPAETEKYPARASAAFPEADIFCAKAVTETEARKIAGRVELPK